jgi:DNA-directed RNA polymerase alpha subunit
MHEVKIVCHSEETSNPYAVVVPVSGSITMITINGQRVFPVESVVISRLQEVLALLEAGAEAPKECSMDDPVRTVLREERAINVLHRFNIRTTGELVAKTEEDLLEMTNFGYKSLDHVKERLRKYGLRLAP